MTQDLFSHTIAIREHLQKFIYSHSSNFQEASVWGNDVIERFAAFASKGKMIRGNCLISSFLFCEGIDIKPTIAVAVAMELMHASLLIHDDIMDNDQKRRGEDSLFFQYQKLLQKQGIKNFREFGKSLATCVGDIGFFLAYELLNKLSINEKTKQKILQKVSLELQHVGLGQMQDLTYFEELSEQSILQTYRYKTARYTFSLPFALGALLAENEDAVAPFERFGEELGIIFQLKDDELGMFGTEKKIGKKVGSDVREGKKTFYWLFLLQQTSEKEKAQLKTIWGNGKSSKKDLAFVHTLLQKYSIDTRVHKIINQHLFHLEKLLDELLITQNNKQTLREFISYNIVRIK